MRYIYMILNVSNGKRYIGSTKDIDQRWAAHKSALKCGNHHSKYLQHSYNKNGLEAFQMITIEVVDDDIDLYSKEQEWIDKLRSADRKHGYNMRSVAGGPSSGYKHSEETKAKISEKLTGKKRTPEMIEAMKGRVFTDEHREKIGAASKGRTATKGRKLTEEQKAKLSESHKGKKLSDEHKAKISAAITGVWEVRRNIHTPDNT